MTKLEQVEKILQENTVVHCKDKNEMKYLYGLIEYYLASYDKKNFLFHCRGFLEKDRICFRFRLDGTMCFTHCDVDYYKENNYNIIECEDLMDKEFTKDDLKQGMIVEDKIEKCLILKIGSELYSIGLYNLTNMIPIKDYTSDLSHKSNDSYSINIVYKGSDTDFPFIGDGIVEIDTRDSNILYKRKNKRKITHAELRELLGEEFELVD